MAYDELQAERIRRTLNEKKVHFTEKKMMGGLCFLVDDKMLCALIFNKKHNTEFVLARIGEEACQTAIDRGAVTPMEISGRPFKGYVFVKPEGYDMDEDLDFWVQTCLDFNPLAKSSKKKKKK